CLRPDADGGSGRRLARLTVPSPACAAVCRMKRWLPMLALLLAACASQQPAAQQELSLRLSPASLGRELALQQHMTVSAHGHAQQMDVAIEVDADAVRMAVMDF